MKLSGPVVRRLDQFDAVRRLGAVWLADRLKHEYAVRSGALRRSTPVQQAYPKGATPQLDLVDATHLRSWLERHASDERLAELRMVHANLQARRFSVFGADYELADWHTDPVADVRYPDQIHWSDIREFRGADLKCVWEPSRFGWAFDLVRLELLAPEAGAFDTFWELFTDWLDHNPPNAGVNWNCGQESSIRLLAVTMAVDAMRDRMDEQRWQTFAGFVEATADRVMSHISYAKSQRNNHLASEAMGLAIASAVLPGTSQALRWAQASEVAYLDVAENLVFADGGTSQYSTNYHRVFVHALAIRSLLSSSLTKHEPRVDAALERAARYLLALVVDSSGAASFHGHDDGANILPLAALDHRNVAGAVDLVSALLGTPSSGVVLGAEAPAWFGLTPAEEVLDRAGSRFETFPDAGIHIAKRGETTVVLRAGPARFRPAHADQLNVEVWHAGVCVTPDRGTANYTGAEELAEDFMRSDHHSTIVLGSGDHMPRVGRFLWSRWVSGRLVDVFESDGAIEITAQARLGRGRVRAVRQVRLSNGRLEVDDEVDADKWDIHWQLAADASMLLKPEAHDEWQSHVERAVSYRRIVNDTHTVVRRSDGGRAHSVFDAKETE